MERLRRLLLVSALLLPVPASAQTVAEPTMQPTELEALLSRDADPDARQASMRKLVALAQSGQGYPAFLLGVLYRHGMDHPARLVERDEETARHWLGKCVDSKGCPLIALASLAELELAAGNAKPAMQWAQAWVVLERELKRQMRTRPLRTRSEEYEYTSYEAYLIGRCYKAMPNTRDPSALGMQWFNELRSARGNSLDRMLFDSLDPDSNSAWIGGQGVEIAAENQRHKEVEASAPQPLSPALGLYLYRGSPTGGRAENIELVEALPTPLAARGLVQMARSMRTKPYGQGGGSERRYGLLAISYNDWQHSLVPVKK
jgi:hypothetical protein